MSVTTLRVILFLMGAAFAAVEQGAVNGMFDQAYYELMHPGCANTPLGNGRNLCPPQPGDGRMFYNGIWFPPGPYSRNGCLVRSGSQPDVEIDPDGSHWVKYYGCRFAEVMAISDVAGKEGGYTKLSSPGTPTGEYCPLWVVTGDYGGHCGATP
jgi:hypothetical protein